MGVVSEISSVENPRTQEKFNIFKGFPDTASPSGKFSGNADPDPGARKLKKFKKNLISSLTQRLLYLRRYVL